jgi:hypothetical protein
MSVADPLVSQSTRLPSTWRETLQGWVLLAVVLGVLGVPLYIASCVSDLYTFQPELEKAGGSVQLEVVGPQWYKDFAGRDRDWLFGTPIRLSAPKRQRVDDRWVKRVARMTSLQTLWLANTQITDRGMSSLAPLAELQDLDLSRTAVGDAGLEQIRGLTKLQILTLAGTQVTDAGLACLAQMHDLAVLDLSRTRVRGRDLRHLANMHQLRSLSLESTDLDDDGLTQLPALPSLTELDLGSTKITSAGLRVLKDRRSITSLSIRNTSVDDAAIETLSSVGHVEEYSNVKLTLAIQGTKITPRGMSVLRGMDLSLEYHEGSVSAGIRAQRDWAALRRTE